MELSPRAIVIEMSKPSRDQCFMDTAFIFSRRGTCLRLSVGACLVKNNRIISVGYCGAPPGKPHCEEVGCKEGKDGGCERTIHAELNAIIFAAKNGIPTEGSTLYVTHSPCLNCVKAIITAGVKRVVYSISYRDVQPLLELTQEGISVDRLEVKYASSFVG